MAAGIRAIPQIPYTLSLTRAKRGRYTEHASSLDADSVSGYLPLACTFDNSEDACVTRARASTAPCSMAARAQSALCHVQRDAHATTVSARNGQVHVDGQHHGFARRKIARAHEARPRKW